MTTYINQTFTYEDIQNSIFSPQISHLIYDPNIQKDDCANIIINSSVGVTLERAYWGYLCKKKQIKAKVKSLLDTYNAKFENLTTSKLWSQAYRISHCLIPVSGFYLWSIRHQRMTPYLYSLKKQNILYLAGLSKYEDGEHTFAIVTKQNERKKANSFDRIPYVLNNDDAQVWLDNTSTEEMLKNSSDLIFQTKRVSRILNDRSVKDLSKINHIG